MLCAVVVCHLVVVLFVVVVAVMFWFYYVAGFETVLRQCLENMIEKCCPALFVVFVLCSEDR